MLKKFLVIIIPSVLIFLILFWPKKNIVENTSLVNNYFDFKELTIPYLQNRKYESNLNEKTKISKNTNYTSYLTSYQSDGLKINGLLTIPNANIPEGGFPAIVFVHGYIPPESYKTTEKYVAYVDYLARSGFVVFKIDLRGHGESEGEPGGAYYSSDYVIDTLNAYSALQNMKDINANKIGLWGHSMAGNIAFKSLVIKKDIPAVVIWAGAGYTYSDILEYGIGDNSYRPPTTNSERARKRKELMDAYGQFDPNNWFWKQISPINYLYGVTTKMQLHHSVDDNVVSIEYSRNLNKILDNTNIEHSLFEYPSGGHNISDPYFSKAMQETANFFKNNM